MADRGGSDGPAPYRDVPEIRRIYRLRMSVCLLRG